ncbi:MAG: putative metal-binding motif-containing protein [Deltaproteobacteria bacterium]|nr:putative metal-binding motif-containing protein [Deltaproteobacteria bacterium]
MPRCRQPRPGHDPNNKSDGTETCDGQDNDCDYQADEGFSDLDDDDIADCVDDDADGDGEAASSDCDDLDPAASTTLTEICDGIDNNCDGDTDEGFGDFDDSGVPDCLEVDSDGDGLSDLEEDDLGTDRGPDLGMRVRGRHRQPDPRRMAPGAGRPRAAPPADPTPIVHDASPSHPVVIPLWA